MSTTIHADTIVDIDVAYYSLEEAVAQRVRDNTEPLFTTSANPDVIWARVAQSRR